MSWAEWVIPAATALVGAVAGATLAPMIRRVPGGRKGFDDIDRKIDAERKKEASK